jgi:nucleotide sugar dehydrogenase
MKIGLIGKGFVGNAIYENLKKEYDFLIYDKDPKKSSVINVEELTHNTDVIFVALPTPMDESGVCDLSIVFDCFAQISCWYNDNIIVLKSTVPPGTCEKLKTIYPNVKIVFSPEFLTEANSIDDFCKSNRIILGGENEDVATCAEIFQKVFPNKNYLYTSHSTAEMVKYFINNFLAIKVSFANEMCEICNKSNIDYGEVLDLALYDSRIGKKPLGSPRPRRIQGFWWNLFSKRY